MSLQAQFAWQAQHFEAIFARASVCLSASSRCKFNGIGIPRPANLMWSKRADCKTGPTKTTLEEALARAFPAKHFNTTPLEMQIPLHLQRKQRPSRNIAPAQPFPHRRAKNDTPQVINLARAGFPQWNCERDIRERKGTLANACGRKIKVFWSRPDPQTPSLETGALLLRVREKRGASNSKIPILVPSAFHQFAPEVA